MARTLVSVTAALGFAAGGLATAGVGFAASGPSVKSAAISQEAAPLAVVNLGLNTTEVGYVQCCLKDFRVYTGAIKEQDRQDGQLGTNSWKAMQHNLTAHQGCAGPIAGIAGSGTRAAFQRFAADSRAFC
ncbi:peptidoglycan-binding protein [Streptomyces sp. NPDC087844]|uniref:peptidoglycan-binding protein n=1 Tax=Streptomyces sp. NPDC087844 TaxID=3365805 RepID=UPI0037F5E1CF